MLGKLSRGVLLVMLSMFASIAPALARDVAIETTIRELNTHPERYLGKKVRVVGYVMYFSTHALYETLDDFRAMESLAGRQKETYPGAVSFRGGEDWLRAPQFAHRRAKIVAEGYLSNVCRSDADETKVNLSAFMTCHDASTDNILLSARIVELLAPGEAFSEAPADANATAKPTPLDWPDYAIVKSLAIKMVGLLRSGKWDEVLAGGSDSFRDDMRKSTRETAPSGLNWPTIYADTYLEVAPSAPGSIMLFNEWTGETTESDGKKRRSSLVTACLCRLKACAGKWPSENDQLRSSGGARRRLPFVCQSFRKEENQPWRWVW